MKTIKFTPEELKVINQDFEELVQIYLQSDHSKKEERIRSVFQFAHKAHEKMRRKSGEPYIHHPIAVARIVCQEIGLGSTSICSALLHDVVEDTDYTVEDIKHSFGPKVAQIVEGLTKLKKEEVKDEDSSIQAENHRRLILTMNDDPRIVLIKIADRLHNLRTLGSMPPNKQQKISGETLEVLAPLANRLGLYRIKTELEDLSFKYDQPERYKEIYQKRLKFQEGIDDFFHQLVDPLRAKLEESKIKFDVEYRFKGIYSISQKMRNQGISFEEISDVFAVRIIFDPKRLSDEILICRQIQAYIEQTYKTRPERLRDLIGRPKANGYEALHLTVTLPKNQNVEIQIRSRRMHNIAETGLAAHWRYKEGNYGGEDAIMDNLLAQMRDILEFRNGSATEFLDNFKASLYVNEVYVYTPKGKEIYLPIGATVLDFAYALHSELGDECFGAKINHKLKPYSYKLQCGDLVEVMSIKDDPKCQPNWLNIAITPNARVKIQATLRRLEREALKKGEDALALIGQKFGIEVDSKLIKHLCHFYGLNNSDELYINLGRKDIDLEKDLEKIKKAVAQEGLPLSIKTIVNYILDAKEREESEALAELTTSPINKKETYQLKVSNSRANYILASCCRPICGDEITGVITKNKQVYVHRSACPKAMQIKSTQGDRLLSVMWAEQENKVFLTNIFISGVDKDGLLANICQIISNDVGLRIKALKVDTDKGIFEAEVGILTPNTETLDKLFSSLKELDNIISVKRLDS